MSAAHKGKAPSNKGKRMPEAQRQKLLGNKNRLGKPQSEETKRRISQAQTGGKHHNFGKKASEETRQKMREAQARREPASEETRQKIGQSKLGNTYNLGRKASEVTRAKMRESQARRGPPSEETRQKNSQAKKGNKNALGHGASRATILAVLTAVPELGLRGAGEKYGVSYSTVYRWKTNPPSNMSTEIRSHAPVRF